MQPPRKPFNLFIFLGFALGAIVLMVPLQHYISMGRYQHYGISIFLFGLGYALHCVWTWRNQPMWPRICYTFTAVFFCSVGLLFYGNPWLDWKTAVQTEEKALARTVFMGIYLFLGFLLLLVWLMTYIKTRETKETKEPSETKELKESGETREFKESKETKEPVETKAPLEEKKDQS